MRNRVVLWALCAGVVLSIATWQLVGKWPALIVGIVAVLVACAAYRIEPPRLPRSDQEEDARRHLVMGAPERPVDQ